MEAVCNSREQFRVLFNTDNLDSQITFMNVNNNGKNLKRPGKSHLALYFLLDLDISDNVLFLKLKLIFSIYESKNDFILRQGDSNTAQKVNVRERDNSKIC